jgi:1-acyl-sn-glycerol-3-phosphate acyltransferase
MGFHLGSFLVAVDAGIPVMPIVISGTRSALRGGQWFPRRSNISVHIGKAVRADGSGFSAAARLRDAVRARMLALCREPDLALEKGGHAALRQLHR